MPIELQNTLSRPTVRRALTDLNSFTTTLLTGLIDNYGTEFLFWHPETIRLETEDDYDFKWNVILFDRLMAGIALLTTDNFYKNLPDFIDLCNILSGSPITPGIFDPADALECAWGITEVLLLSPPDDEEPFNEEIRYYIGEILKQEGIIIPPDILRIAIYDPNAKLHINNYYTDDPAMFNAIWDLEESKTNEINEIIKERLKLLIEQLENLKLLNGDVTTITRKMSRNLEKLPQGGSGL